MPTNHKIHELEIKYPKIFGTGAGFRGQGCSMEIGDGWYTLIDDLCAKLQADADACGSQPKAYQVKEKFGGLRFYVDIATPEQQEMIGEAEEKSTKLCEVCGAAGTRTRSGWIKTLCKAHNSDDK